MIEFIHPTTGKPPAATNGYDFYSYSAAIDRQHCAWDVGSAGMPVRLIKSGLVIGEGWHWQLGNHVYVLDAEGMVILYAHLEQRSTARAGQNLIQGVVIGYVGATGVVNGAHLHFAMSFATVTDAAAKVRQYGGPATAVKWREDLRRAFVDPAVFIDKVLGGPPEEEDEMELFIIFKTNEGPQFRYLPDEGKFLELTNAELRCMEDAVAQKVATISRSTGSYQEAVDSGIKK